MIKYIFRSATGSFSRTIGRILAYALIGILILFLGSFLNILNVNAAFNYWGEDLSVHGNILYWNGLNRKHFTSSSKDYTIYSPFVNSLDGETIQYAATTNIEGNLFLSSNATANVPYGIGVQYNFIKNQVYSLNYYVCFTNGYFDNWNTSSGGLNDIVSGSTSYTKYSYITRGSLLTNPYRHSTGHTYQECQLYSQAFVPTENVPWVGIWFTPKVDSIVDIFGFDIEMGGVYAENSNDDLSNQITEMNTNIINQTNKIDDTMKDDKVEGAQGSANSFFNNFEDKDYGLSGVITMPLTFINKITSGTCTPLSFSAPFVDQEITLPCMYNIYTTYFGDFLSVYQTITFGVVSYWVCVNIFQMVKNFKDPDKDEIEVLDL